MWIFFTLVSILSPKNKKYLGYFWDFFTWDWKVYLGMDTNFFLSHVVIAFVCIKCFSDNIFRSIASFVLTPGQVAINLTCFKAIVVCGLFYVGCGGGLYFVS